MKPIWLILKPGISAGSANGTGPLPPRGPRKIKRTPYPEVPDCDMSHPPLQSAALVLLERHWHECMKSSTFGLCRPTNGTLGSPWKLFSLLSGLDGPRAIGQSLRNRRVLVNLPVSPAQSTSGPFILSAPPLSVAVSWLVCLRRRFSTSAEHRRSARQDTERNHSFLTKLAVLVFVLFR